MGIKFLHRRKIVIMPGVSRKSGNSLIRSLNRNKYLWMMVLPALAYFIIFCYVPMYGAIIAFQDYAPGKGFLESNWAGLKHFKNFFGSVFFYANLKNTILLGVYYLFWYFPVPLIFALLLNELKNGWIKKSIQSVSYLPYFISLVVVVGLVKGFLDINNGIVNTVLMQVGLEPVNFLMSSDWFRTIYIGSGIWQNFGWGAIIYLSAIASISPDLYEAADMDGATRFQKMINITLPSITPIAIILLILNLGSVMNVGFEKVLLLYNPAIYDVSDVISTYTYRKGILNADYSYATAVGLFNSVVNFMLLVSSNWLSKRTTGQSLW